MEGDNLDLYATGTDGNVYHRAYSAADGWGTWTAVNGEYPAKAGIEPYAVTWGDHENVFWTGDDYAPAAVGYSPESSLYVYAVSADGAPGYNVYDGTAWSGSLDDARTFARESLALRRAGGDQWGIAVSLAQMGGLSREAGDLDEASRRLIDALAIAKDGAFVPIALEILLQIANLRLDQGHVADAREMLAAIADCPAGRMTGPRRRCSMPLPDAGDQFERAGWGGQMRQATRPHAGHNRVPCRALS